MSVLLFGHLTFSQDVYFDWAKKLDRSTGTYEGYSIGVDEQKNVYFTGEFRNTMDLDPGSGVFNAVSAFWDRVFIVKLDPAGNFIWGRTLDGDGHIEGTYFHVNPNGDLFLTGLFSGTTDFDPGPATYNLTAQYNAVENYDIYTMKLDKDGNFKWAHSIGDFGADWSHCVTADLSGNVYTTGYFTGIADFDPGPAVYAMGANGDVNTFVTKYDQDGNLVWAKSFIGYFGNRGAAVRTDFTGNVYVSGRFEGGADFDPGPSVYTMGSPGNTGTSYMVKLDANGNFIWARENMAGADFEVDANQEIVTIAGNAGYHGELSRYDMSGNLLWTKITGGRPCFFPGGSSPIKLDAAGNIFLTGEFNYTSDFDPGPGTYNMTAMGGGWSVDAFICRLDPDGNFVWAKQFGNGSQEAPTTITMDGSGSIYTIGTYLYTVDFDPGPGVFTMDTYDGGGIFIHKMSRCQNVSYSTLNVTACSAYTLNNHTYTQSGTYIQTVPNSSGCDSIITLHLTLQNTITDISAEACDTYTWNNQVLSTSGTYTHTFTSAAGCDSIVRLQLLIRNKTYSSINATICEGNQYEGYTNAGIYVDVFTGTNGCDSVRTLNLHVNEKKYSSINAKICNGQTYLGHTSAGIYVDVLTSAQGCDSVRTLTLDVSPVYSFNISKTICQGETYMGHTTSGTYIDRMQTVSGCDSIQTTIMTVLKKPNPILGNDTSLCREDSLILHAGNAQTYAWQDNSSQEYYVVKAPGLYSVVAANSCGTAAAKILVEENPCIAYFPNAFTPNKDGRNDYFGILNAVNITQYHLTVYNRWGQLIFESKNPAKGWDGTFNGQALETNVFVWQCTFKEKDNPKHLKGSVVLIR